MERYLYTLHRLTGLGLIFYFLLHILVTSARAFGEAAWVASMGRVTGPLFTVGEYLVFLAFAFHAANGLRLAFIELGWGVGKPFEPVYPYKTSVDFQRPLAIVALLLAALLAAAGTLDFFVLHKGVTP
jgi:succinate dehydrogenase / fumarate reductase cytochrome b subunit